MASSLKALANRKTSNIWPNAKTGRWYWEVELKRSDGTVYRRAGSRKTERDAKAARDDAFAPDSIQTALSPSMPRKCPSGNPCAGT